MRPVEVFVGFVGVCRGLARRGASGTVGALVVLPDHTNKKARAIIPWPCDALKGGALPVLLWLYTYVTVLIS